MLGFRSRPRLSVIVVFYNMRREARRTLLSLTTEYQRGVSKRDYEVIVLDSNSTEPLDGKWVESLQDNFSYYYIESPDPTPCRALNRGAALARGEVLVNLIDGARILSPGILNYMLVAEQAFETPFTYTIGMHLGHKRQGESVSEGYNQAVEDELLATVRWESEGYELFRVSCLAGSSKEGFLFPVYESNCFSINRRILADLGGFDEAFKASGGGLVNLDVFRQLFVHEKTAPVMLVGEATFHQFHGGVSTNVPVADNPWDEYNEEYAQLRGEPFQFIGYPESPVLMGTLTPQSRRFFLSENDVLGTD